MQQLPIADIKVDPDRFRRTFKEVEALADSIKRLGQIQPIVLDNDNTLIAGERRLRAHKLLKRETINVIYMNELSESQKKMVELEENIRREPLTWQEECKAKAELHKLYIEEKGKAKKHVGGGWSIQDMADLLGESYGKVSQDLALGEELLKKENGVEVAVNDKDLIGKVASQFKSTDFTKLKSKDAAFKVMKGNKDKALRHLLATVTVAESNQENPTASSVDFRFGDCLEGLKTLSSESVDLVLTDPEWGINIDGHDLRQKAHGDVNVDSHSDIAYLEPIIAELYRVLKKDSHLYMFFAFKFHGILHDMLKSAGFKVDPVPLIWIKGNAFNQWPYEKYTHDYEAFLFCRKGNRRLNKTRGSIFEYAPVPNALRIHLAEKPLELLKELIELSTIENELVVEPFAGSGKTLMAAMATNRRAIGWELDEKHHAEAQQRLSEFLNTSKVENNDESA